MEKNKNVVGKVNDLNEIKHGMRLVIRKNGQQQEEHGRVLEWCCDNTCQNVKEVGIYLKDGGKLKLDRESIKNYTVRVVKN